VSARQKLAGLAVANSKVFNEDQSYTYKATLWATLRGIYFWCVRSDKITIQQQFKIVDIVTRINFWRIIR
jgi:hypothetical protein